MRPTPRAASTVKALGAISRSSSAQPTHLSTIVAFTSWPPSAGGISDGEQGKWILTIDRNGHTANRVAIGVYTIVPSVGE